MRYLVEESLKKLSPIENLGISEANLRILLERLLILSLKKEEGRYPHFFVYLPSKAERKRSLPTVVFPFEPGTTADVENFSDFLHWGDLPPLSSKILTPGPLTPLRFVESRPRASASLLQREGGSSLCKPQCCSVSGLSFPWRKKEGGWGDGFFDTGDQGREKPANNSGVWRKDQPPSPTDAA